MSAQPIPLRRFYVYVLKGADDQVFYVGRGTGGRMMQHMARSHNERVNGRMSEAVAGDERIIAEVVSWHSTREEATAAETALIRSFPDHVLANVSFEPNAAADTPEIRELEKLAGYVRRAAAVHEYFADRRDALVREIADDYTLATMANAAGVSMGRISSIRYKIPLRQQPKP